MKTGRIILGMATMLLALSSHTQAEEAILKLTNSGWGNTGVQTTAPAAFVMSVGFCPTGPNCNSFGVGMINLNPLTFYPSTCTQRVKIYSGPAFDAIVSIFAQNDDLTYWVPRVLSNDGSVPTNFFQSSQRMGESLISAVSRP